MKVIFERYLYGYSLQPALIADLNGSEEYAKALNSKYNIFPLLTSTKQPEAISRKTNTELNTAFMFKC